MNSTKLAKKIFIKALKASDPARLVKQKVLVDKDGTLTAGKHSLQVGDPQAIYIIAAGKASRPMLRALKEKTKAPDSNLLCITPDKDADEPYSVISSHPVPDQKSEKAADKLLDFIERIPAGAMVLFALSGGASALICKPVETVRLQHINELNELLLASGAAINEINGVRKHLSQIKGGGLLRHFQPDCTLLNLVISDVPGDDLEIIGSGPTTPDSSTFQDAYDTLLRYDLWEKAPASIRDHIEKGRTGEVPETLKPGDDPLKNHASYIIGSAQIFAGEVAAAAREKGFRTWIASQVYNQPVKEVAAMISEKIKQRSQQLNQPVALIFYGESTVKVTGNGKGGRNQELALHGALKIDGLKQVTWLSAGTDGIDGPTDAAGAIVDGETVTKAEEKGLNAEAFIKNNDSYHFHEQMGTLLKTGPTGNNVMDVVMVLIEGLG